MQHDSPARVSWSNVPRPETRQRRSLRLGGGQGLFGTSSLLRLTSLQREAAFTVVTAVDALRMCCDTACAREAGIAARLELHYWPAIDPRTATWTRIPRRPPCRSTVFRRSKHSRHRHRLFRGASFAVSPSPVHACTPVTSDTPAALAVARSQQTGCRHGTKERALEACKDGTVWQNLTLHSKVPSFPAHRRRVLVRRGSPALLHQPARNIIHCSPCSRACCDRPSKPSLTDDPRILLGTHYSRATRRARGFCVLLPGWLYILYDSLVTPVPSLANWTFHTRFHYRCSPKGRPQNPALYPSAA